jgi:hypothetical protein
VNHLIGGIGPIPWIAGIGEQVAANPQIEIRQAKSPQTEEQAEVVKPSTAGLRDALQKLRTNCIAPLPSRPDRPAITKCLGNETTSTNAYVRLDPSLKWRSATTFSRRNNTKPGSRPRRTLGNMSVAKEKPPIEQRGPGSGAKVSIHIVNIKTVTSDSFRCHRSNDIARRDKQIITWR